MVEITGATANHVVRHISADSDAKFRPKPRVSAFFNIFIGFLEVEISSIALPYRIVLGVTKGSCLVEISFESDQIAQSMLRSDAAIQWDSNLYARCHGVVHNDVHPSRVDLCDRISPKRDVTKVMVE